MFGLLNFILTLSARKEEASLREDLKLKNGKLAWYEDHFGKCPDEINYLTYIEDSNGSGV